MKAKVFKSYCEGLSLVAEAERESHLRALSQEFIFKGLTRKERKKEARLLHEKGQKIAQALFSTKQFNTEDDPIAQYCSVVEIESPLGVVNLARQRNRSNSTAYTMKPALLPHNFFFADPDFIGLVDHMAYIPSNPPKRLSGVVSLHFSVETFEVVHDSLGLPPIEEVQS